MGGDFSDGEKNLPLKTQQQQELKPKPLPPDELERRRQEQARRRAGRRNKRAQRNAQASSLKDGNSLEGKRPVVKNGLENDHSNFNPTPSGQAQRRRSRSNPKSGHKSNDNDKAPASSDFRSPRRKIKETLTEILGPPTPNPILDKKDGAASNRNGRPTAEGHTSTSGRDRIKDTLADIVRPAAPTLHGEGDLVQHRGSHTAESSHDNGEPKAISRRAVSNGDKPNGINGRTFTTGSLRENEEKQNADDNDSRGGLAAVRDVVISPPSREKKGPDGRKGSALLKYMPPPLDDPKDRSKQPGTRDSGLEATNRAGKKIQRLSKSSQHSADSDDIVSNEDPIAVAMERKQKARLVEANENQASGTINDGGNSGNVIHKAVPKSIDITIPPDGKAKAENNKKQSRLSKHLPPVPPADDTTNKQRHSQYAYDHIHGKKSVSPPKRLNTRPSDVSLDDSILSEWDHQKENDDMETSTRPGEDTQQQVDNKSAESEELRSNIHALEQKLKQIENQHRTREQNLLNELQQAKFDTEQAKKENMEVGQIVQDMESVVDGLRRQNKDLRRSYKEAESSSKLQEAKQQIIELKATIAGLETSHEQLDKSSNATKAHDKDAHQEIEALRKEVSELKEINKNLKEKAQKELLERWSRVSVLEAELASKEALVKQIVKENKEEANEINGELKVRQENAERFQGESQHLRKSVADLEHQLAKSESREKTELISLTTEELDSAFSEAGSSSKKRFMAAQQSLANLKPSIALASAALKDIDARRRQQASIHKAEVDKLTEDHKAREYLLGRTLVFYRAEGEQAKNNVEEAKHCVTLYQNVIEELHSGIKELTRRRGEENATVRLQLGKLMEDLGQFAATLSEEVEVPTEAQGMFVAVLRKIKGMQKEIESLSKKDVSPKHKKILSPFEEEDSDEEDSDEEFEDEDDEIDEDED